MVSSLGGKMSTSNLFSATKGQVSDTNSNIQQENGTMNNDIFVSDDGNLDQNVANESIVCGKEASGVLLSQNNAEKISEHISDLTSFHETIPSQSTDEVTSPFRDIYVSSNAINPSPITFTSTNIEGNYEKTTTFENIAAKPLVNAASAPYQTTDDGVHISIPIPPASVQNYSNFNENYGDGADSDGEIGPFLDAVQEEKEDEDDDIGWDVVHEENYENENNGQNEINPVTISNSDNNDTHTTESLMKLSNALLRDMLKTGNQSTNGN